MAKKKQGIGYIENLNKWIELRNKLVYIVYKAGEIIFRESNLQNAINYSKGKIDELVGRSRQDFTKTDIYQLLFLYTLGYFEYETDRVPLSKINTIVAKLTTEGVYGNTGIVRRQTTLTKLNDLVYRVFSSRIQNENDLRLVAKSLYIVLKNEYTNSDEEEAEVTTFGEVVRMLGLRGTRSTTTTRRSNRTTRGGVTSRRSTPRTQTLPTGLPSAINEIQDYSRVKSYIDNLIRTANNLENRKRVMGLTALLFRFNLRERLDMLDSDATDIGNNYLMNEVKRAFDEALELNLNYFRAFAFAMMGFRTTDANRMLKELNMMPESRENFNMVARVYGFETQQFRNFFFSQLFKVEKEEAISFLVTGSKMLNNFGKFSIRRLKEIIDVNNIPVVLYGEPTEPTTTTSRTTPATTTSRSQVTESSTLIRDRQITNDFDFGVEWEHFGVGLEKLKKAVKKAGQDIYPKFVNQYEIPSDIKRGLFPNGQINKGYWVLQHDGTVSRDRKEPSSEFRNTKQQAITRNTTYGYNTDTYDKTELVSPVLGGKRGLAIIKRVAEEIVKAGARHNSSTGMHVHITKKGFNHTNIKNLFYNYAVIEPIINQMFEPNRRGEAGQQWTKSLKSLLGLNSSNYKSVLKSKILDVSDSTFKSMYGNTKYQMVNLVPFYSKNTIEFRGHGGNYEYDTVVNWIRFLFYFAEFSKTKRFQKSSWDTITKILPVGLATFWYNRIQDLSGKSPYDFGYDS